MNTVELIKNELFAIANPQKATILQRFFKTEKGGYGEGDIFIGVTLPQQREIVKKYQHLITFEDIKELLYSEEHEIRLISLIFLVKSFEKAKKDINFQKQIVEFYIKNIEKVNNWDLVDLSCYKILGPYLINKEKSILYEFTSSENFWIQRVAMISTFYFIKKYQYDDALLIAEILINHKHDLIHKAVGWMLKEIGKRNFDVEFNFLIKNYKRMPRTMLRYSIEKFDEELRQKFLKGKI
jgi:3-methyladenine DNA glycosylase AlkD